LLATFSFTLKLDFIVQFGAAISSWLHAFQLIFQLIRSLHTVEYVPEGGKHFIDVSSLSKFEKWYLAKSLARTVNACIDSGSNFRLWMVEKAIHEAFRRAMQARAAWLRELYSEFGTTTWFVAGLFRVTLRSPDIHFAEENAQDRRDGVTVDELEIALHHVNEDILVRHPAIFCRPEDLDKWDTQQWQQQEQTDMKHANTFMSCDPLQEAGHITASMDSRCMTAGESGNCQEGDDDGFNILHQFIGETQQYQIETSNVEERERLEATLRELERECEQLQGQLEALVRD